MVQSIKKKLRRRNAIEPIFGHMKQDGHLGLNRLKGKLGDRLNAVLAGVGQNCRTILAQQLLFYALISYQLLAA
ncbi:hypothetical protein L3V43_09240 [Pseudoalteromonas sp. L23]|uniref:hypothetical protein n=1 Tax=unclassified Pseudoalteromonas TaxID=194690 RepID=UPI00029AB815|nr:MULTISPECIES: hypothetical protein [unclassified Pseudoalteromonas]MCF2825742.1 hypothetical protein [Pseudoalteromonas sp. OF5H-5]MCF2831040.1 hypothetical protein [Pseudoalteromonas sp. DL2-H6]MCF2923698.1 hypothetical protein [Pseudoalteromonas sp. DL2-H1]MCF7513800.1 hypothetical protein [Pseudoalteromonas sp. L7]MCF7525840.1 hypothetical protein [Pseudoalteromonas sp. L23]